MAISNIARSRGLRFLSDACRKGTRANKAVIAAVKANNGHMIVLVHPLDQIMCRHALRVFLYALHLMKLKSSPPGYNKYLKTNESTLKQPGPPVTIITNSSLTVPFWLIGLRSPRHIILVGSKSDSAPTPIMSEVTHRASWRMFASRLKGLGVKSITLYGESSEDCVVVACTGLYPYFKAGIDGKHVFPQEKYRLYYQFRCGVKRS